MMLSFFFLILFQLTFPLSSLPPSLFCTRYFAPFPFLLAFFAFVRRRNRFSQNPDLSSSSSFFFVHLPLLLSNVFRHLKVHQSPQLKTRLEGSGERKKTRAKKRTHAPPSTHPQPYPLFTPFLPLSSYSPLPFPLSPPLLSKLRERRME